MTAPDETNERDFMRLAYNPRCTPGSPVQEERDASDCECVCEYDHCADCDACGRRNRGQCDACDAGECNCRECNCDDYCTCETSEGGLYSARTDVLDVFNARVFDNENPQALLLGAEVELECNDMNGLKGLEGLESAYAKAPVFIGKEDGSLQDGIEMVTLPLTLEEHSTLAAALESEWFPVMKRTGNCGMHAHISKVAFDDDAHMERFADFFSGHNGHNDWNLFLDRLFRRSSNHYCERLDAGKALRQNGKYSSVNFSKQYTLEVRGFASTRTAKTYMANMELVVAVRDATFEGDSRAVLTPRNFVSWIAEHADAYPHLAARLEIAYRDDGGELFAPWLGVQGPENGIVEENLLCA